MAAADEPRDDAQAEPQDYPRLLARLDGLRVLGVDFGLERVNQALERLGSPQRRLPAIQIAGTNGKGSTAAMTEAILRRQGLRTGLFTSPHLSRFTERIRVAGVEADGDRLARLDQAVVATGVPLTYFEVSAVLGFLLMAEEGVEVAVLETGLGGRLDAVTTCHPLATAVTSISWDHTEYLGTTLRAIAHEKAGIIKPGVPHHLGELPAEALEEMERVARALGAPLCRVGRDFQVPPVPLALAGAHQQINAAVAVALAEEACRALGRPLDAGAVRDGLAGVRWPGRMERVAPDVLLDCAHNPEGASALAAALPALVAGRRSALVISVVGGKDLAGVLAPLVSGFDHFIVTRSRNPRALPAERLAAALAPLLAKMSSSSSPSPNVVTVVDPLAAVAEARRSVGAGGLVVVAGSIFLVGELRAALLGEITDPTPVSDPM